MPQKQSVRPVTPAAKALAAACDILIATQWNFTSSMSFSTAGKSQTCKVTKPPGFKGNYFLGEGSDGNRSGHEDVVALRQQKVNKVLRKKPSRPRDNNKKSEGADLHLALIGEHLRLFF